MWATLSSREKRLVGILLAVLLLFFGYRLLWNEQLLKLYELRLQNEEMQVSIGRAEEEAARLEGLTLEIDRLNAEVGRASEKFFDGSPNDSINEVVGVLEQIGTVTFLELGDKIPREDYLIQPLRLGFKCDYESLINGIKTLETGPHLISVQNVSVVQDSPNQDIVHDSSENCALMAELEICLFHLPETDGDPGP